MNRIATFALAMLALASLAQARAADTQAKNLQILPKNIAMKELKEKMKLMSRMLGVQCDHCHDTDDFAKDTEDKKTARAMMTMVMDVNKRFFANKDMVNCATCHNGHAMPPMGGTELDRIKAAEKNEHK
jgi:hypothetical protein